MIGNVSALLAFVGGVGESGLLILNFPGSRTCHLVINKKPV